MSIDTPQSVPNSAASAAPGQSQQIPAPLPPLLTPEVLNERVARLINLIRQHGCTDLAISLAESITDTRSGGRAANVLNVLPQFRVDNPDGSPAFDARLDLNGNHVLEKHELTSALLTAATVAATHNIAISAVQINDEFIALDRTNCVRTQQGSTGVCRVER